MNNDTLEASDDLGLADLAIADPNDDFTTTATPGNNVDTVKQQFEFYLEEARKTSNTDEDRKAFGHKYFKEWSHTTRSGHCNFLHFLANADPNSWNSLSWLMLIAIFLNPRDMGVLDKSNKTPLTVAIASGNEFFVVACIKNFRNKGTDIKKALEKAECVEQDNDKDVDTCLHFAINADLRSDLIKRIIENVSEKTFCRQDHKGRTPLHLAVDYEKCCDSQVEIVSHLLRFGPRALEIMTTKDSSGPSRSVYQYHETTRKLFERKNFKKRGVLESKIAQNPRRDEGTNLDWEVLKDEKKKKVSSKIPSHLKDSHRRPELENPSLKGQGPVLVSPTPQERQMPQEALKLGALNNLMLPDTRPGALENNNPQVSQPQQTTEKQHEERKVSADKIREQLKLLYLRTTKPNVAFRCLQTQDGRDKQLWFDLGPETMTKFTEDEFKKHFSHLKFDTALQYVAFPQVELIQDDDPYNSRQRSRKDMVTLFQWLRDKGVKRIIKVIVDDLRKPCHSDEDIEKALNKFEVEILDWRKLDLCPVTVSKASTSLREIHLQWSGRNTVLRGWSECEGLAKTPSLKAIHLIQIEKIDSDDRTQRNLKEFGKRLKSSWPDGEAKPVFYPPNTRGATHHSAAERQLSDLANHKQKHKVDAHKWMKCMETFVESFRNIKGIKNKSSDPSLDPVTVALIDDGVDTRHEALRIDKFLGKSFDTSQEDEWRINPYWVSAVGQGTLMARFIRHICPSAVIYVIKLKTFKSKDGKLRISSDSAIEAIEHATEQGAQIISMSWAIKPPLDTTAFDNAIKNASTRNKPVLMFCSASDQGHFSDYTYPHSSNPNSVFRIGASTATGAFADFVGDPTKLDLAFPGHEVDLDTDADPEHFSRFASHTGSSIATAIAAGLAALVLECVRLGVIYTQEARQSDPRMAINKEDLFKIRNKMIMMDALKRIGTGEQTQNKYIEVWKTFDTVTKKLKQEEGVRLNQLDVIAGLAQVLLNKGVEN